MEKNYRVDVTQRKWNMGASETGAKNQNVGVSQKLINGVTIKRAR